MSLKILICDSDWRFVERAIRFLSSHGHQVMNEALPSEALDLASHWHPDVVILASESTEGANEQVIAQLKRLTPRPAILLTGQLDRFDAAWRAWRKGGDELLLKPVINAWELYTAIVGALNASSPAVQPNAIPA